MSELCVTNRDVAVPGEVLAKGMDYLPGRGTYRKGEDIIALKLGLVNVDGRAIKLTPLSGRGKGISPPEFVGAEDGNFEFIRNYLENRGVQYEKKERV